MICHQYNIITWSPLSYMRRNASPYRTSRAYGGSPAPLSLQTSPGCGYSPIAGMLDPPCHPQPGLISPALYISTTMSSRYCRRAYMSLQRCGRARSPLPRPRARRTIYLRQPRRLMAVSGLPRPSMLGQWQPMLQSRQTGRMAQLQPW
jgi:hypothetical protein